MLFKRLCTRCEAEGACLVPPFPEDCCPAENGIAAGLGRKPVTCCLAEYCFVPVFKAYRYVTSSYTADSTVVPALVKEGSKYSKTYCILVLELGAQFSCVLPWNRF